MGFFDWFTTNAGENEKMKNENAKTLQNMAILAQTLQKNLEMKDKMDAAQAENLARLRAEGSGR